MKRRTKISIVIGMLVFAVFVYFYKAWIPVIFWHITHKNPIVYHNLKIKVPLSWIAFEEKDSVVLLRQDKKVSTSISRNVTTLLDNMNISEKDIDIVRERLKEWNAQLIKYGQIALANKTGNYIDFIKQSPAEEESRLIWRVITFPTENVEIRISSAAPLRDEDLVILDNVFFENK